MAAAEWALAGMILSRRLQKAFFSALFEMAEDLEDPAVFDGMQAIPALISKPCRLGLRMAALCAVSEAKMLGRE